VTRARGCSTRATDPRFGHETLAFAIALAGCTGGGDDYPIQPGNGFPTTGGTPGEIAGRVCLIVADPRALATCASGGAGGLTVTLGGVTATTAPDGTFTMVPPASANLVFAVTGPGMRPRPRSTACRSSTAG